MPKNPEIESLKELPSIKRAEMDDLNRIAHLYRQLHVENVAFIDEDQCDQKDWIVGEIQNSNIFIFEESGLILGAISFEKREDCLKITTLAVDSSVHRMGIGKRLLAFATQKALDEKFSRIKVNSYKFLNARDFYLKCGFEFDNPMVKSFKGEEYWCFTKNL